MSCNAWFMHPDHWQNMRHEGCSPRELDACHWLRHCASLVDLMHVHGSTRSWLSTWFSPDLCSKGNKNTPRQTCCVGWACYTSAWPVLFPSLPQSDHHQCEQHLYLMPRVQQLDRGHVLIFAMTWNMCNGIILSLVPVWIHNLSPQV